MKIQSGTNRLKRRTDVRMLQLYSLLAIPVFLVILFKYVPMFGIIIAFKDYKYNLGIFGSEWVGFENFKFFFQSNDFLRITKNTLLLNGVFITTGVLAAVTVAILLFELRSRTATIDAGVCAVMSSARMYPAMDDSMIDGRYTCVGFSKKILIDRLKGEMGFDGVVITDDVNMGGYTSYYEAGEIYGRFLEAGHDVLLGVGVDALDRVMNCVERGIVSEERITDACRRVLDLKEKVGLFDDDYTRSYGNREEITIRTKDICDKIARDGITLLRNRNSLLPMKKIDHVTIFTFTHKESIYGSLSVMKEAFEERGAVVELKRRPESFEEIQEAADKSDLIIYAGYIGFHAPKGAPSFYGDEFWSFRYAFTAGKEKSMGISLGYPFIHHYFMDDADTFINLYSPNPAVQKAFVAAVYGETEFKGVPPLDMEIN